MSVNEKMTAIADAIRMYTGKTEPLTLDAMEDGVHEGNQATKDHYFTEGRLQGYETGRVEGYNSGYEDGNQSGYQTGYTAGYRDGSFESYETGKAEGITEGREQGKQAEYDAFWDAFQENGNRTNYNSAFFYWSDETFQPKYDIVPTGSAISMCSNSKIKNLKDIIEKAGIIFDTSKSTDVGYMFNAASYLTEAPLIDATNSTSVDRLFNQCGSLKKASVVFPENKITAYTNVFQQCVALEDFTAYGVIDFPLSLSTCSKLTNASVQSIIDCLKDLTGATAQTLTLHKTVKANLTEEQLATITGKNWSVA